MRALLLLLALAVRLQDPSPADLLRNLEDDRVEVREQAQKRLIELGNAVLPLLKETLESPRSSGELKLRTSAVLRAIELNARPLKAFKEPKRVTLKADGTLLREILDEVARQAEVAIDSSAIDAAATVTMTADGLPLFQVLDLLCKDQAERTWESLDDGNIRLLTATRAASTAASSGSTRASRETSAGSPQREEFRGRGTLRNCSVTRRTPSRLR